MFIRFDRIPERDRQTDGRTDIHCTTAYAALMHSIAQQKQHIGKPQYSHSKSSNAKSDTTPF